MREIVPKVQFLRIAQHIAVNGVNSNAFFHLLIWHFPPSRPHATQYPKLLNCLSFLLFPGRKGFLWYILCHLPLPNKPDFLNSHPVSVLPIPDRRQLR